MQDIVRALQDVKKLTDEAWEIRDSRLEKAFKSLRAVLIRLLEHPEYREQVGSDLRDLRREFYGGKSRARAAASKTFKLALKGDIRAVAHRMQFAEDHRRLQKQGLEICNQLIMGIK